MCSEEECVCMCVFLENSHVKEIMISNFECDSIVKNHGPMQGVKTHSTYSTCSYFISWAESHQAWRKDELSLRRCQWVGIWPMFNIKFLWVHTRSQSTDVSSVSAVFLSRKEEIQVACFHQNTHEGGVSYRTSTLCPIGVDGIVIDVISGW